MTDINRLKQIMMSQDINVDDERFERSFRIFENPAGCELCGARTKVGLSVPAKGKIPAHTKTACCNSKVG